MAVTRRAFTRSSAGVLALAASPLARPALGQNEQIRIGWIATLTGPLSAPGIGFDRGVRWAAETINAKGGAKGRLLDIITRDTQGDPTKAVNTTQEMISSVKAHAAFGPHNSGESLATTPIMAKARLPDLHSGVLNALIDPVKYPNAFRLAPSNTQWDDAVRNYCLKILKAKTVAITGDATGYGTSAVQASVASFKADGATIVYDNPIEATQPDLTADLSRMRNSGAEAIVCWTVSTGMAARMMNARAAIGWDVPIVGHPVLGSGDVANLVARPENWRKVYMVGYRSCSFGADGKLPPRTQDFVDRVKGKISLSDTSLWWVLLAVDGISLIAEAVDRSGSSTSDAIIGYLNTVRDYPGLFGRYNYTPEQHNGFPTADVVMSEANSQRDGAFTIAPGYG